MIGLAGHEYIRIPRQVTQHPHSGTFCSATLFIDCRCTLGVAGAGYMGWFPVDGMDGMDEPRRSVTFLQSKVAQYYE